jgi:hypothetical protein
MIHNLGSKTTLLNLHKTAVVSATGAGTPANVDLQGSNDFEGDIAFIIDAAAAGSGVTLTAKLQHSDTTTSGDFVDISGGGFTAAAANTAFQEKIYLNSNDLKRYVRVLFTVTGGTGTGAVSVVGLASKKYGN